MKIIAVLAPVIAIIALFFAYGLSSWIGKIDEGTEEMKETSGKIKEGVMTFLKRESKAMMMIILVLFVILGFIIDWTTAMLYVIGAFFSISAGFFGMRVLTKGNVRTVSAAMNGGLDQALKVSFRSGAVTGLCVVSLGLLGIGGVFIVLGVKSASVIAGLGLGASTIAVFRQVGGGNFTTDNPAGNVAGMGSDLFGSYVNAMSAIIILASITKSINPKYGYPFDLPVLEGSVFPLILLAVGIIASVLGIMFIKENRNIAAAFKTGTYISNSVFVILTIILSRVFFGNFNCAISVLTGLLAGIAIGKITEIHTLAKYQSVKNIAEQSQEGYSATILRGLGTGMRSTLWTALIIAAGILIAYDFAGFYGIVLAAVGMLSATGIVMTADAYSAVSSNSYRIVQSTKLPETVKSITEDLDSFGQKTAATRKVFSICSAALTTLALLIAYTQITELKAISIMKPIVLAGLIFGAMLPFLFSALTLNSVGKIDHKINISIKSVFKKMVGFGLLAIIIPLSAGIILGTEVLAAMLLGSLTSGLFLATVMTNAGGAWKNAKNYIEEGNYGGKGSNAHQAAVVGDMVGTPLKNTAGPTISVLIKLMAMVAVVFAPIIVAIGGLL